MPARPSGLDGRVGGAGPSRAGPGDWPAMEGNAMPQRLTPLEVSLLVLDTAHAPAHVGTVDIFDAEPDGLDYERLIGLIRERIAYVPRYRQRVRDVPARLAGPGLGGRRELRPHLPRPALRAAATRARWSSCASSSAGWWLAGWTGRGRCGRCTSSRGWRATGSPSWPSPI